MRGDVGQPLRVGEIALSPWDALDVRGITQSQLGERSLEGVVGALPVDTRRFHRDGLNPGVSEEDRELTEALSGCGETLLGHLRLAIGSNNATARDDRVSMDVEPGDPVSDPFHDLHLRYL